MLFEVGHLTRFTYDHPVLLEPLTVRLRPRCDVFQRLISFDLTVEPSPEGMSQMMDVEGNALSQVWFLGVSESLTLRTSCTVETLRNNPFDYIVLDPEGLRVPMVYPEAERRALARYLEASGDPAVEAFAAGVLRSAGGGATAFLGELCLRIASTISQEVRRVGDPLPAGETLARRTGACRDLAVLYIDACRSVGIAARFVTGYEMGEPGSQERELHAWAEVYVNGAGWRGYDPTLGLAVADRHVAVAAGAGPPEAAPTSGTFRGSGVASNLETVVNIHVPTYGPSSGETSIRSTSRKPLARVVGFASPAGTSTPGPER
ncbi:MAG TPA: transglutaminase family protein [Actinomycetota bacterium]|nr:transglutaminase family protein [Actinomycetota bacterium]